MISLEGLEKCTNSSFRLFGVQDQAGRDISRTGTQKGAGIAYKCSDYVMRCMVRT